MISLATMFCWVVSLFGFKSIRPPLPLDSEAPNTVKALHTCSPGTLDQKDWPEGPQRCQYIQYHEPDGWAHSHWSWCSNGYVDCSESLHPKLAKAESRHCLGVLKCHRCGKVIQPSTKMKDMRAQLDCGCLDSACADELESITCKARTLHFVTEEDGVQYSVWEHTGSHHLHPHPPAGQ